MWNFFRGLAGLIFFSGLYFVLPVWGIRKLYLWLKKRGETRPKKSYRVVLVPIIILNAIPGFIAFLSEEEVLNFNEDVLGAMMMGIWVITIIHAIIQYRLAGLWIGPVRVLLGLVIGVSAGVAIILALGLVLLLVFVASSEESSRRVAANTRRIYRNGRYYEVYRMGDSDFFSDPETKDTLHILDESHFMNQDGESFEMWK